MEARRLLQGDHRRQKGDPFRESRIQRVIKDARATLVNPTRPETPQDRGFYMKGMSSRQGTPVTLQPIDRSVWGGKAALGAPGTEPPPGGTPGVTQAQAKAAQDRGQYFAPPQQPDEAQRLELDAPEEAETDPKFITLKTLVTLLETEHSVTTLREALAKVNQVVDQILASLQADDIAGDRRLARLAARLTRIVTDADDPTIQLRCCRVLLKYCASLPVEQSHETVVASLHTLYQLSKSHENDALFRNESILEPILMLLDSSELDVLTLSAGVIKNTSNSPDIQEYLGTLGAIRVLTNQCRVQIQKLTEAVAGGGSNQGTNMRGRVDLVIQITGSLRNLSLIPSHAHLFTKLGTIGVLYPACFQQLRDFRDIVLNANRILAKLSHSDDCKMVMDRDTSNLAHVVATLCVYKDQHPIAVRLLFTLGNVVQSSEANRMEIGLHSNLLPQLIDLFAEYCERDEQLMAAHATEVGWPAEVDDSPEPSPQGAGPAGKAGLPKPLGGFDAASCSPRSEEDAQRDIAVQLKESDDVLVKMVRFFANLSISSVVGPALAASEKAVTALLRLLQRKKVEQSEELVLNSVCCVTNMSYYVPGPGEAPNMVTEKQIEVGEAVAMLLMHDHVDAVVEVGRVFGNFSRSEEMREWMMETRVDEACAILVDHSDRRVVLAVCGVLLNFSADPNHVALFSQFELVERVQEVLDIVDQTDFELLALLFKLCYNLADKGFFDASAAAIRARAIELLSVAQTLPLSEQDSLHDFPDVAANTIDLLSRIIASGDEESSDPAPQ